jgi:hypothetical protein
MKEVFNRESIGKDTTQGVQTEDLDMGGYSIDDVNVVNLKAHCCTVHNNTGSTLVAGVCLYPTGEVGGIVAVAKCDNTGKNKMPCLGVVSVNIADGNSGCAVCLGIKGMDTSGFTGNVGDRIYVQSDGTIDTVEPTSGSVQRIGILVKKDAAGRIYIHTRGRKSIHAASGEDTILRMGDSAGVNKVSFKDYADNEVASLDSNGKQILSGKVENITLHSATEAVTAATTYGDVHKITGAYTLTLSAAVIGMCGLFRASTVAAFSLKAGASDHFEMFDGTVLDAGDKQTSGGTKNEFIQIYCEVANTWITISQNGAFTDGGA